jgi:AcrR family transcriptional regulator
MSSSRSTSSRRHRAPRGQGASLRAEIIAAAKDLLAASGHEEAVSVRAVAERVGITTPSIYMHFKDKQELIDAVCADVFGKLADAMRQAADEASGSLEKLFAQGRAYVNFALAQPEHYRLATMVVGRPGSVDAALADDCFTQLLATVAQCVDAGIFPSDPAGPLSLGLQLWSAVHGVTSLLISKPWLPWGDTDAFIDRATRIAVVGCALADAPGSASVAELAAYLAVERSEY